ncbi:hypothetical protein DV515_00008418, partial [Chloebia gouldiae]
KTYNFRLWELLLSRRIPRAAQLHSVCHLDNPKSTGESVGVAVCCCRCCRVDETTREAPSEVHPAVRNRNIAVEEIINELGEAFTVEVGRMLMGRCAQWQVNPSTKIVPH